MSGEKWMPSIGSVWEGIYTGAVGIVVRNDEETVWLKTSVGTIEVEAGRLKSYWREKVSQ